jgi:hypothetical protein
VGLDYGYEIVIGVERAGELIEALAGHLAADDRLRLLAAYREYGADLMRGLDPEGTSFRSVCFSFRFSLDEAFREYGSHGIADEAGPAALVGCVWSSVVYGDRYVLFRGTAATTQMSILFRDSASVRSTFVRIGATASASAVLFDDEQGLPIEIWPRAGRVAPAETPAAFDDDEDGLNVDRYCAAVLAGEIVETW